MAEEQAPKKKEAKAAKVKRPTALKRDIQNVKRRTINRAFKSTVRTAVRNFDEALVAGDKTGAQEKLNIVYSLMDRAVKRGIFKQNKASRTKARFAARTMVLG